MLGRLAKWLRLLGYDTVYSPSLDDADLARLSLAEDRLLLTRDTQLAQRRRLRSLLIKSDHLAEQLAQVRQELCLAPSSGVLSRCLRCNTSLDSIDRADARETVPPHVWRTHECFSRCPSCGRIYWPGTHWERMHRMAQRIQEETAT
jgi:uncharacterized protein with PIN domain